MIKFNELKIYNNTLIIDVSVKDLIYYDNIGIDKITISLNDNSDPVYTEFAYKEIYYRSDCFDVDMDEHTLTTNNKFLNNIYCKFTDLGSDFNSVILGEDTYTEDDILDKYIYKKNDKFYVLDHIKDLRIEVPYNYIPTIFNKLLYIKVYAEGTPSIDTPCGMDNTYVLGITFDLSVVYNNMLNSVKEVNNTCKVPRNFIDYFLKYKALQYAIKTKNYTEANNIYDKYMVYNTPTIIKKCNCNG